MDKPEPREVFDLIFEAVPRSATMRRIRQEVYGPDFPAELDAFSYVTAEQLRRFATELGVGPGDTFADLGCGCGGPGLWVARETGASIAGIDFSSAAIAQAESSAASFGVAERARYARADIASTGLPPGSVDAAMSVDVVQITPSRAAVFTEVARILRPGARFIFTSWDLDRSAPPEVALERDREPVYDSRPMLEAAGFDIVSWDEDPGWLERHNAESAAHLANAGALTAELGETVAEFMLEGARKPPALLAHSRRFFAIAQRWRN